MFKRSRKKIVISIMSILVLLWVGTLGVIYVSSYAEVSKQNREMLQAHARMYSFSASFEDMNPHGKPNPDGFPGFKPGSDPESPMFRLSTFYTVALSYEGKMLEIRNDQPTLHSDSDLREMAQSIVKSDKTYGTKGNLAYYQTDKNGYKLVAFMDNTVIKERATTLFRYTLIFGGVALGVFFFLSRILAKLIVNPLEEIYQKQKQFISDAGHELKTPISVISANAELLSRRLGEDPWLQNIRYENERMGTLVGQLLELARTENVTPMMERIDFSRLVAGEALPFEGVAFEKGLILNCSIAPGLYVYGNGTQLKQTVSILMDNAIRHSKDGDEIRLILKDEHGAATLSVINKGEEIPKDQRERIFERFYRADPVRNGEDGRYGLGLAIAKAIVTSHKGRIDVQCYDGFVDFSVKIHTVSPAKIQ